MRWKCGLIVVDVDNVDAQSAGARQLRRPLVRRDNGQSVKVSNFTIEDDVGLDDAGERRLDDKGVVVVAIDNVVDGVRIGARISIRRRHLRVTKKKEGNVLI